MLTGPILSGGLNSLKNYFDFVTAVEPQIRDNRISFPDNTFKPYFVRNGNVVHLSGLIAMAQTLPASNETIILFPSGWSISKRQYGVAIKESGHVPYIVEASTSNVINLRHEGALNIGDRVFLDITFILSTY